MSAVRSCPTPPYFKTLNFGWVFFVVRDKNNAIKGCIQHAHWHILKSNEHKAKPQKTLPCQQGFDWVNQIRH
ncbi:hypothetical protein IM753_02750 [Moraxella sp. K127]|uniref:hypothetical protein n=1 Tax=Moraxella sp. K127 TaxID=2780079 RepID=UPI00187F5A89|nr:hypothetical protein [Moraxella sp. K127]MBE9589910.1 hypothetical protein [Moraxella sp. K127]